MNNRLFYSSTSPKDRNNDNSPLCFHEELNDRKSKKTKIDFKEKKDNTIKSLNEVEFFLNDLKHFGKYIHLYKFFK